MKAVKQLTVLGATGSIGASTLAIVRAQPEQFRVFALSGHRQVDQLAALCLEFTPNYAVVTDEPAARLLRACLSGNATRVLVGEQALIDIVKDPTVDIVMAAIVGAAGLAPTHAAIQAGKQVLLANKEALVMAGDLMMQAVIDHQATLLPVDSEHNALFQCMPNAFLAPRLFPRRADFSQSGQVGIDKIILTASGGSFRDIPLDQFAHITPEQACLHPNWSMGKKITVDSATMMNKALEVIEAHYLFGLPPEKIEVLIHPQSVVHSLVVYQDGSSLAQLGEADMRIPIANAMAWPDRIDSGVKALDLCQSDGLHFKALDEQRYPAFHLGYLALQMGGTAPCVLNAANEIAVDAFLNRRIPFTAIASINRDTLAQANISQAKHFEAIIDSDQQARRLAQQFITQHFS